MDSYVAVVGWQQIETGLTVVAPMSNSHGIAFFQMIKCGTKERFLSRKFPRGANDSALVADHYKPQNDRSRVNPGVKCSSPNFTPIIKYSKVLLLEISNGEAAFGIVADDIDQ